MAIKELFYDQRPVALLNPRASQRIDPRFKFTRDSVGTYIDGEGLIKTAPVNTPRLSFLPNASDSAALLLEPERTNYIQGGYGYLGFNNIYADDFTLNAGVAPDGTNTAMRLVGPKADSSSRLEATSPTLPAGEYVISFFLKYISGTQYDRPLVPNSWGTSVVAPGTGSTIDYANGWERYEHRITVPSESSFPIRLYVQPTAASTYLFWGFQFEEGTTASSYIYTTSAAVTREADLLSIDSLSIPSTGSVYIDARAIGAAETDTLISLKNASNEKINLSYESNAATYNSLALIASYKGTSKSSLPLPVPTTNRERNIITWGANNYQYTTDSSRYATSLSSSVPASLTQLSIGHDAVDPTKAFNGYINAVYLYNGEITPAVAEALVRGELDPINADTYSPSGPTGSLALVINTQGATADGDKTFTLPAESALNDNDIVITWGDGTESGLNGASAELGAPGLTHTYPAAGIYPVWVEGQLENLQFNNIANAPDLVQIAAWGTTANGNDVFLSPSTMNSAFYGCTQMDFSASARTTNLPDTSAVTDWTLAFRDCSSITGTFPAFNLSSAVSLNQAWRGCSSMTSFIAAGDQTQNVNNFSYAWRGCSSLTNFPQINTSAGTSFLEAWRDCSSLTTFPQINTSAGTNFSGAWYGCAELTSFPLLNTSLGDNFSNAWSGCSSLNNIGVVPGATTSFPLINTAAGTNFSNAWFNCSSFTNFPLINTAAGTNFTYTWYNCNGLTAFPTLDFSSATTFNLCWAYCTGLTAFPAISTSSSVTNFSNAWRNCTSMATFGVVNTSSGTNFGQAWRDCNVLASFPALNFDSAQGSASDTSTSYTGFREAWFSCDALTDFPANRFNSTTCTRYLDAWTGCALTAQSIENILVSINTANTSNGNLGIGGGTNAAKTTWSSAANTAYDALVARGWTITFNA